MLHACHNPAGGLFVLVSLRTPPFVLPLMGIEWEAPPEAEEGPKQGAAWTLAEFSQVDTSQAAQQQRLNLYVFLPA